MGFETTVLARFIPDVFLLMMRGMSEQPLISVIVPVYNVEDKLSRCVESVFAQTYPRWELILVDDGSLDNSGSLCDEYVALDARVHVIHQSNAGVSAARNAGMELARGDWWTFVDSDDSILPDFFAVAMDTLRMHPAADLYFGQIFHHSLDGKFFVEVEQPNHLCSLRKAYTDYSMHITGDMHAKLFRSDIICEHGIRFPLGIQYAEDHIFLFSYLLHTENVFLSSEVCYNYYRAEGTLSTTPRYEWAKEERCVTQMLPLAEQLALLLSLPMERILRESFSVRLLTASLQSLNVSQYRRYFESLTPLSRLFWCRAVVIISGRLRCFGAVVKNSPLLQYYVLRYYLVLRCWAKRASWKVVD